MYIWTYIYKKYPYMKLSFKYIHLTTKERPSDTAQFLSNI